MRLRFALAVNRHESVSCAVLPSVWRKRRRGFDHRLRLAAKPDLHRQFLALGGIVGRDHG
jgi:hypothetical protein